MKKVTILGAGNGAQAFCGDLAEKGYQVTLFEHPQFEKNLEPIRANGNIVELVGKKNSKAAIHKATSDISEAIPGADAILFVAPAPAQKPIFDLALPYLEDGQIVVLVPGDFGSLALKKSMKDLKIDRNVTIAETTTLPYGARIVAPAKVFVMGIKTYVGLGVLPGSRSAETIDRVKELFPGDVRPLENVLYPGFANGNMVLHCVSTLMNLGRIEKQNGNFPFYMEGMTPSVCNVMEAVDAERLAVARAYGLELDSAAESMKKMYQHGGNSLYEAIQSNPLYTIYTTLDAPTSIRHRYISEDVPFLLVPVSNFARLAGVPTPVIDAVILMAEKASGRNFSQEGLTLEALGLVGMSVDEIKSCVSSL